MVETTYANDDIVELCALSLLMFRDRYSRDYSNGQINE